MQAYSDPKRESDPHALPDLEVFEVDENDIYIEVCPFCTDATTNPQDEPEDHTDHVGWYWQSCFPGCMPDGDPNGPFSTAEEALEDARQGNEEEEEEL